MMKPCTLNVPCWEHGIEEQCINYCHQYYYEKKVVLDIPTVKAAHEMNDGHVRLQNRASDC